MASNLRSFSCLKEEPEAQRTKLTCPRLHSLPVRLSSVKPISPAHLPGLTDWTQMQIIPGPNGFRSQGLARSLAGR